MKYSLATNWDQDLPRFVYGLSGKEHVIEFFGAIAFSALGNARPYPNVAMKDAEERIANIQKMGFGFNYLINSSVFPDLSNPTSKKDAKLYLDWIRARNPSIITAGNEETIRFLHENAPEIEINVSIVMALKEPDDAVALLKKYPMIKRITPHQTVNRDKHRLMSFIDLAHKYGAKIELLANEICLYDCNWMKEHYAYDSRRSLGGMGSGKRFRCDLVRAKDYLEFLNACWIRPEDVSLYDSLGVDIIKIAGRGWTTDYLKRVAKAYLEGKYEGNVIDLFYGSWWPDGKAPYSINNRRLNGFIKYLWDNGLTKYTE